MKVLALSDVHGNWRTLKEVMEREDYEVVLIAGDLSDYGGKVDKVFEVISDVVRSSDVKVYSVLGNMDDPQLLIKSSNLKELTILHGGLTTYLDYLIVGFSGGLRSPFHTYFELSDDDYHSLIDYVVRTLKQVSTSKHLILLTHTPPYNTKVDLTYSGLHIGSEVLRRFIESYTPKLTVCGHVHEARGVDSISGSLIVNPGPLFRGYYTVINLGERVDYLLKRLE